MISVVAKNAQEFLLHGERCAGVDAGRGPSRLRVNKPPAPIRDSERLDGTAF
jgi:hypothetical protein